jgi:cytochrome b pre-mRNA-processing protein 3
MTPGRAARERNSTGKMNPLAALLPRLVRRGAHERAGFMLYSLAVTAARDPWLYTALGVPDTLDGRFDLIGVHVFVVIHHLRFLPDPGPALAQAVFDAMFSDMDQSLREMGVGDLSVGRRVRAMWEAFHGRSRAYEAALASPDYAALPAALTRNVWRGRLPPEGAANALARVVRAQLRCFANQDPARLVTGEARLLGAEEAAQ